MSDLLQPAVSALALITGASKRLGKAFALALAKKGYAIGLHYHHSKKAAYDLADELETLGVPVLLLQADLRKPDQIDRLCKQIEDSEYKLEVLINSAAEMKHKAITEITPKEWDDTMNLNLKAVWYLSIQAAKRMKERGFILNLSDIGAEKAWSGFGAYSISKAGINSLTFLLARALAPQIRVCAIAPGLVLPPDGMALKEWDALVAKTPIKRAVNVESVTKTMEFLLENAYITGEIVPVDGGRQLV